MGVGIMKKEKFEEFGKEFGSYAAKVGVNFFWIFYRCALFFLLLVSLYKLFFTYEFLGNVFGLACDKNITFAKVSVFMWLWLFLSFFSWAALGVNHESHLPPREDGEGHNE